MNEKIKQRIMEITTGVYETLISQAIEEKLKNFSEEKFLIKKSDIDSAESYKMLANYLAEVVAQVLKSYFSGKDRSVTISNQVDAVNRILKFIEDEWVDHNVITSPDKLSDESFTARLVIPKSRLRKRQKYILYLATG